MACGGKGEGHHYRTGTSDPSAAGSAQTWPGPQECSMRIRIEVAGQRVRVAGTPVGAPRPVLRDAAWNAALPFQQTRRSCRYRKDPAPNAPPGPPNTNRQVISLQRSQGGEPGGEGTVTSRYLTRAPAAGPLRTPGALVPIGRGFDSW